MIIGINAGHCLKGAVGSRGIIGSGKEEIETREILQLCKVYGEKLGHTIVPILVDEAYGSADLDMIVNKANSQKLDLFASIHLNCFSDPSANGTETYIAINSNGMYASQESYKKNYDIAKRINDKLVKLGFRNRGVKEENFRVIANTKCHAVLIETCFISSPTDKALYNKDKIARAIIEGITGQTIVDNPKPPTEAGNDDKNGTTYYRVIAGSFQDRANAEIRKKELEAIGIAGVFLQAYIK